MSKRQFKSQASSSRAISGAFPTRTQELGGFGASASSAAFASSTPSQLSYITEPLDLSRISQPSVIVSLKNLSKKDSITKAKALEDIESFLVGQELEKDVVEDALLEAWVGLHKMYISGLMVMESLLDQTVPPYFHR